MDSRFPQKQNTSEKLKARQYGAAGFICLFIADDESSLFSDWKSGERSPVKVSLAFIAGIIALALVIVIQG